MKRWAWIGILAVAGTASAQSIEALAHLVRSHGGEVMLSELDVPEEPFGSTALVIASQTRYGNSCGGQNP